MRPRQRPKTSKNQRFPGQLSPSERLVQRGARLVHQHKAPLPKGLPVPGDPAIKTRARIGESEHYQQFEDPQYLASLARDVDRRRQGWGMARDGVVIQ